MKALRRLKLAAKKIGPLRRAYYEFHSSGIYYLYRYLQFRSASDVRLAQINLEWSSSCNLRCKWCPIDHAAPASHMTEELLAKLLSEIGREDFHVKALHLHNGGETLMHPRFIEMLQVVSEFKKKSEGFPVTTLLTNATLLNEQKIAAIVEGGAIDFMRFSVDGGNRRDFEEIRRGANWDQVLANVNSFLDANDAAGRPCSTAIISLIPDGASLSDEFKMLISRCDEYLPRQPHDFDGSKNMGVKRAGRQPAGFCCFIFDQMVVLPDGMVTACCADLSRHISIGDAKIRTLKEIYHGKPRRGIIEMMRRGQRSKIELCRNCFSR